MKKVIPVGETRTLVGQGEYFYIASATGRVLVIIESTDGKRSSHEVASRFQLRVPGGVRSAELVNRHNATNTVDVETGIGEFIPSGDGQRVVLTGSDVQLEVRNPPGTPLEVDGPVTDAQMRAAPVPVSGPATDAEMRASPLPVAGDVQIAGQDVSLQVHTIPGGTLNSPAPLTPDVTGDTIPANPARESIVLYAPADNLAAVWVGSAAGQGIPLEPGKFMSLKTTAAIPLFAANATDEVTCLEIE